jgi:hypothetical protein
VRAAALLLVVAGAVGALQQKQLTDKKLLDQLAHLFPPGTVFSPKEGTPQHFSAYVTDPATRPGALLTIEFTFPRNDEITVEDGEVELCRRLFTSELKDLVIADELPFSRRPLSGELLSTACQHRTTRGAP